MPAKYLRALLLVGLVAILGGCAAKPPVDRTEIDRLAFAITQLGPDVDPEEAARAARIAYDYPLQLAEEWQVTDPPLIHNAKVLHGFRERGLCNDWAKALLTRLGEENFRTLDLHWSTSPPLGFRVIHHSAVISRRGDTLFDGIVLDPWRYGGVLYWSKPEEDPRYDWGIRGSALAAGKQAAPAGG